jgi:hypothetical protein
VIDLGVLARRGRNRVHRFRGSRGEPSVNTRSDRVVAPAHDPHDFGLARVRVSLDRDFVMNARDHVPASIVTS